MKFFGPFRLDTSNHCLWRGDERMVLTPKAFDLLRYLVERADRLVTQDEILEGLWPETYVNPEGVRKYILEIRKVLGDRPKQPLYIETLTKRGYQFIARVTEEQTIPPRGAGYESAENIVGRDGALAEFQRRFERAASGQRQVIFVTGEAGIGKTTLVDAFQQQIARHPNVRVARGQCIEGFGGTEAYYPMLEAVGALVSRAKDVSVPATLAKLAPTWLAQFPSLVEAEQREALQREILGSTRGRMVREICEALEGLSAQTPLIVILEDLHWADPSTLDVISALARRREPAKLVVIATYRPVDVVLSRSSLKPLKQDLMVHNLCHEIAIEALEESDVRHYLAHEFAVNSFPSGFPAVIHYNSGGNPLFLAAIVGDLVNRGSIAEDGGKWSLTAPLEEIYPGIPDTLQQMLETQFERLPPEEQSLLQSCTVIGEHFSVWAAAIILGHSQAEIEEACHKLAQRQQFIRFAGVRDAVTGVSSAHYEFRHALYRQALYRRLSGPNRSKLHRSLAEGVMSRCPTVKQELASELALHFEEGRDYHQATHCFMLAAENAVRRFAHREAIKVLRHALQLTSFLDSGSRTELQIQILQRIGDSHYALGSLSDAASAYETAATTAAQTGRRAAQLEALARLSVPAGYLDPERGKDVCEQAVAVSRQHGDPLRVAQSQLAAACFRVVYDAGRNEDAEACVSARREIERLTSAAVPEDVFYAYVRAIQGHCEEALRMAEGATTATSNPAAQLVAAGAKILTMITWGRFGEALRMVRSARELAQNNDEDPWMFIITEAWLRARCFDFDGVRNLTTVIMRNDAEEHALQPRVIAMLSAGYAELHRNRCADALHYFEQVCDETVTPRFFLHWHWRMHARLGICEARLQAGDLENARLEIDTFLDSALFMADPNFRVLAWEAKARVAIIQGDLPSAAEFIESALGILDAFDIPVVAWRVHATGWELYGRAGQIEKAEGHRARAADVIMRLADSFEEGESLRESLLNAVPIRRIFEHAVSA